MWGTIPALHKKIVSTEELSNLLKIIEQQGAEQGLEHKHLSLKTHTCWAPWHTSVVLALGAEAEGSR